MSSSTGGITGPIYVDTAESLAQQRADNSPFDQVPGETLVPLGGPNGRNGPAAVVSPPASGPAEPGK